MKLTPRDKKIKSLFILAWHSALKLRVCGCVMGQLKMENTVVKLSSNKYRPAKIEGQNVL